MRLGYALALAPVLTAVLAQQDEEGLFQPLRTIALSTGHEMEASFDEILELKRMGINFFDLTNRDEIRNIAQWYKYPVYPESVSQTKRFNESVGLLSKERLEETLTRFTSFYTRYSRSDTGVASGQWLLDQINELVGERNDIFIKLVDHEWKQKSIIVSIKGSLNPDKVVVVGSHQDSINLILPNVMPAPGADDDGSGAMTILEVFNVLMQTEFKPENTVEFHWYAAEELGCLGSLDVYKNYSEQRVNVRSMLQQDMTGFSKLSKKNTGHDEMGLITDYVSESLTEYIKLLISTYCTIPYSEAQCGYACSDHASANEYGYPSAFVIESAFENINNMIHTTEDTVDKLDFEHMLEHARLTLGYALELAYADI